MKILSVLYLILTLAMASPYLQLRVSDRRRRRLIRALGRDGGGAAVALLHRQETIAVFGLPFIRFMTVSLPDEVAAAVRRLPADAPLDIVAHLPGGLAWDVGPLRAAVAARSGPTRLVVPSCCLSAGRELAQVTGRVCLAPGAALGDEAALDTAEIEALGVVINGEPPLDAVRLLDRAPQASRRRPSPLFAALPARLRATAGDDSAAATSD